MWLSLLSREPLSRIQDSGSGQFIIPKPIFKLLLYVNTSINDT